MQHDHVLKKLNFDLLTPYPGEGGGGGGGVCRQNIFYHVAAFLIPFNLICNITVFWKSWILTFWLQPGGPGMEAGGGGGGGKGVCWQNICHHAAAFVIPFNLICNMTVFWKSWILTLIPLPKSTQGVRYRPSVENHVWYVSYLFYLCLHSKFQLK